MVKRRHVRRYAAPEDGRRARLAALARHRAQKRGTGEPVLPAYRVASARQSLAEAVADTVSAAMRGTGHRQLGRRLGRDMGQTLRKIYMASDVKLSTLADIALATGHELVIEFRHVQSRSNAA